MSRVPGAVNGVAFGCTGRSECPSAVNIHHLELFYYVARHGGISCAVRCMPYGIQQPAVSSQILLLEQDLGIKLFDRRPFRLTAEGEQLYACVRTFFDSVEAVGTRLRRQAAPQIRIGASELILRDHLPAVIQRLRQSHSNLRLGLRAGYPSQLEVWLQDRQIDFAVVNAAPQARPRTCSACGWYACLWCCWCTGNQK
jgi:DNA-binding transcriptional LysR family regulator